MEIVGNGFVARNLAEAFGDRYPRVTALAAGVSSTSVTAPAELDREAELLYATLRRCPGTLLFFSTASFAMYGSTTSPVAESEPVCPPSVYGRHKLALESVVRSSGVDFLVLRLSHLVGRHQRAHQILPGLTRQVRDGRISIHSGAYRDLLDVADPSRRSTRCSRVAYAVRSSTWSPVSRFEAIVDDRRRLAHRRAHVRAERRLPYARLATPAAAVGASARRARRGLP